MEGGWGEESGKVEGEGGGRMYREGVGGRG
jgi:hypothetical protein